MTHSKTAVERRLKRLERLLVGRRARLAAAVARREKRRVDPEPFGSLQTYGYPVAALLAVAALMPTVLKFGWGRRKLLLDAATNAFAIRKLRKRLAAVRSAESGW